LLAFLLTTVFNALPIGAGPSSIAATTTLFSGSGIDKTASAGLVLLGSAVAAAGMYSIWGGIVLMRRMRRARSLGITAGQPNDDQSIEPPTQPLPPPGGSPKPDPG
jgi:hypothetical protein